MKLNSITLQNFKGIDNLKIKLDGKTTVIFGVNGVGKSTILQAIDLLYADIIAKLMGTVRSKTAKFHEDYISYGKSVASINADFGFGDGESICYERAIDRAKGEKRNTNALKKLTDKFQVLYIQKGYDDGNGNWIEEPDNKNMPIFVNYGVNRIVLDVPVRAPKEQFLKLDAFDKAIESTIDFRNLFKWFRNQEDIENQIKVRENPGYEDSSLAAVKKAMLAMLDGFEDIRIERRPLAMKVKKNGKSLKIDQLSDGEKCTIALFGDLARRMALANPEKENPLEGSGVVLIDELDLHMHTSWQRKVLNVLRDTFPNVQFIITTHSPQILGEMDDSVNLLYLYNEDNKILFKTYESFVGWDANVILEEVMNTSSVNQDIKKMVMLMVFLRQEYLFQGDEDVKQINKNGAPQWFEQWKTDFVEANSRQPHYKVDFAVNDSDGIERRRKLREALIKEQGKICCYCMRRISNNSAHIEHFYPQESYQDRDLLYENMFASCNGEATPILEDEHCGHRKNNWFRDDMLSPTDIEVEKVFKYSANGKISAVRNRTSSNVAQDMIHNLGLDSFHLERDRKQAIQASEVFDEEDYTDDEIRSFIEYYSNKNNDEYEPYCKAIVDCLEEML